MTKLKFLLISFIALIILFTGVLFITINSVNLSKIWFSLVLLFIGMYIFIYYILFGLDSSLYCSILLGAFSIATANRFFQNIDFVNYYPIYLLCFALASLSVFVRFRQYIHFKLFAILCVEAILLTSYKIKLLTLQAIILVNTIFLAIIAIIVFSRVRKNLRRE